MNELVSIIMPTKNRSELLKRAIYSVLGQTYRYIELLVVDDGSTDNTCDVVKSIDDPRLRYIKNETSAGACVARNIGINASSGSYITFLDDDDEYCPERLEVLMREWDSRFAYVCSGYFYIKTNGVRKIMIPERLITLDALLTEINIGNSVLTLRSRVLDLGGFDELLTSSQDYDLWVRLNHRYGPAKCVQEPLFVMHTEHEEPRITFSKKKPSGHFKFYLKHKHLMSKKQRKTKLYEVLRYRN